MRVAATFASFLTSLVQARLHALILRFMASMFKDGEFHEENGVVDYEMEDVVGSLLPSSVIPRTFPSV